MSMALSAIERLYLIMFHDCHVCVIPDIYIATESESASKLKVNLHRCTGDRAEFSAFAGGPGRNAAEGHRWRV